jgi:FkbM family methyltransferase
MKSKNEPYGQYALKGIKNSLQRLSASLPNTFLSFKIALVLRKITLQNRTEIVDVESVEGLKVRLFPMDNVGDRIALFMPWFFESEEFAFIKEVFKPGGTFLDIGANTGYYSLFASKVAGSNGKVVSFEPNPEMVDRCTFNIEANNLSNVDLHPIGLADKEGEFQLGVDPGNLGGATIIAGFEEHGYHSTTVKCRPLTTVLKEIGVKKIDFMKIDVEKAEPIVLNPFFETADNSLWPEYILIETVDDIPFEELGYELIKETKNNTIFKLRTNS